MSAASTTRRWTPPVLTVTRESPHAEQLAVLYEARSKADVYTVADQESHDIETVMDVRATVNSFTDESPHAFVVLELESSQDMTLNEACGYIPEAERECPRTTKHVEVLSLTRGEALKLMHAAGQEAEVRGIMEWIDEEDDFKGEDAKDPYEAACLVLVVY